jgi:catechol 2,3-dioxygenase-like lactoylglutathione lyase family enzyme
MPNGKLEHANVTVSDPGRSSALLQSLLGWRERWRGPAQNGGETIHVGDDDAYVAFYTNGQPRPRYSKGQPLNHLAFTVDDLDGAERVVIEAGLEPFGHDEYDPGRRFYFFDWDGIEFEIVSYAVQ